MIKYLFSDNPKYADQQNITSMTVKDNIAVFFVFDLGN
jgi:hypothetical protein